MGTARHPVKGRTVLVEHPITGDMEEGIVTDVLSTQFEFLHEDGWERLAMIAGNWRYTDGQS